MRAVLSYFLLSVGLAGCAASRIESSREYTSVPTYSTPAGARGGGPMAACGDNMLSAGTMLQARLDTPIDTHNAVPGQPFYATLTQPMELSTGGAILPTGTQLMGRIYQARPSRRFFGSAHLALGIEGLNFHGTYIPVKASVAHADVNVERKTFLSPINSRIPTGSIMAVQLEEPLPVVALQRAEPHLARGGGPCVGARSDHTVKAPTSHP